MRIMRDFKNIMRKNLGNSGYLFSRKNTRNFYKNRKNFMKFVENFEEIYEILQEILSCEKFLKYYYDISMKF